MMYIHYCRRCDKILMLNGHKAACPACGQRLHELKITFLKYTSLSETAREEFHKRLHKNDTDRP